MEAEQQQQPSTVDITLNVVVHDNGNDITYLKFLAPACVVYATKERVESLNDFPNLATPESASCANTYLKYITERYHNLPDTVVFYEPFTDPNDIVTSEEFWKNTILQTVNIGYNISTLTVADKEQLTLDFGTWFEKEIGHSVPIPFVFYTSNCFAIRKDYILRRPLSFYQRLLTLVDNTEDVSRSWFYIFLANYTIDMRLTLEQAKEGTVQDEVESIVVDDEPTIDVN